MSAALALLALIACNGSERPASESPDAVPPPPYSEETIPSDSPPSAGVPDRDAPLQRPLVKQGVTMIEGMADTVELRLVQAPDDFPMRFSTYVPADFEVSIEATNGGHSLELTARFGGVLNERAYLQVYFYPRGTTRMVARNQIDGFLTGLNPEVDRAQDVEPWPWALEQTRFSYPHDGRTFVGSVALAQRGDVLFHYVQHYPAEYGDGMAGRIRTIMEEWRWSDGEPLVP